MASEQERQSHKTSLQRLQEAYNQGSDIHKRLKPELDRAKEEVLKPTFEALDEIWQRVLLGGPQDIVTAHLIPGGRCLRIRNIRASDLQNLNFQEFPINLVVSEDKPSLFKPEDEIEIDITNSARIMINGAKAEKILLVDFLSDRINFTGVTRSGGDLERTLNNQEVRESLNQLLSKALLEEFSTKSDNLVKVLAVNELVQVIYQVADDKIKTPANS